MTSRIVNAALIGLVATLGIVPMTPAAETSIDAAAAFAEAKAARQRLFDRYVAPGQKQASDCRNDQEAARNAPYPSDRLAKFEAANQCFKRALTVLQTHADDLVQSSFPSGGTTLLSVIEGSVGPSVLNDNKNQQQDAQTGVDSTAQDAATAKNAVNFMGWNLGIGAGYLFGIGPKHVTASVVNNIVRVSSDNTSGPRVVGEAHYYFENKNGSYGIGPFAALEVGSSSTTSASGLTGFGLGVMFGWQVDSKSSSGFNIGVGYMIENSVQTLGDGITANQPLPSGETQVRYKDRSAGGIAVLFSWKFGSSVPTQSDTKTK